MIARRECLNQCTRDRNGVLWVWPFFPLSSYYLTEITRLVAGFFYASLVKEELARCPIIWPLSFTEFQGDLKIILFDDVIAHKVRHSIKALTFYSWRFYSLGQ